MSKRNISHSLHLALPRCCGNVRVVKIQSGRIRYPFGFACNGQNFVAKTRDADRQGHVGRGPSMPVVF